jgi:hypothetical protein
MEIRGDSIADFVKRNADGHTKQQGNNCSYRHSAAGKEPVPQGTGKRFEKSRAHKESFKCSVLRITTQLSDLIYLIEIMSFNLLFSQAETVAGTRSRGAGYHAMA